MKFSMTVFPALLLLLQSTPSFGAARWLQDNATVAPSGTMAPTGGSTLEGTMVDTMTSSDMNATMAPSGTMAPTKGATEIPVEIFDDDIAVNETVGIIEAGKDEIVMIVNETIAMNETTGEEMLMNVTETETMAPTEGEAEIPVEAFDDDIAVNETLLEAAAEEEIAMGEETEETVMIMNETMAMNETTGEEMLLNETETMAPTEGETEILVETFDDDIAVNETFIEVADEEIAMPTNETMGEEMLMNETMAPSEEEMILIDVEDETEAPTSVSTSMTTEGEEVAIVDTECSADSPCDACHGDCDSDAHCEGLLECYRRPGADASSVPGCTGIGVPGHDYCYMPTETTARLRAVPCSDDEPCVKCEGDCDGNDGCIGDLECYNRPYGGVGEIPGCDGTGIPGLDYCYDPNDARRNLRKRILS